MEVNHTKTATQDHVTMDPMWSNGSIDDGILGIPTDPTGLRILVSGTSDTKQYIATLISTLLDSLKLTSLQYNLVTQSTHLFDITRRDNLIAQLSPVLLLT